MARTLIVVLLAAAVMAGCQDPTARTLPLPNLNGPVVAASPAPNPVVRQADPVAPAPARASAIPEGWQPRVRANNWQWIVIHHSATPAGSAAQFDRSHRQKGWDELGYHFVIGNGTGSRDGQVEVGSRWLKQKYGAHCKTADNRYNEYGIGICLVGDFEMDRPTAAQMRSLAALTAYLMRTYHIPASRVIGHSDAKPTDCPGRHCSIAEVRRLASHLAATGQPALPTPTRTASAGPAR